MCAWSWKRNKRTHPHPAKNKQTARHTDKESTHSECSVYCEILPVNKLVGSLIFTSCQPPRVSSKCRRTRLRADYQHYKSLTPCKMSADFPLTGNKETNSFLFLDNFLKSILLSNLERCENISPSLSTNKHCRTIWCKEYICYGWDKL